ncbi:DUF1559 domain-containing protein [Lacipirellula parvula]|uniref:DUF1559 domain-containing protein n=1 Tax=Lacipirellula parvula TaxID=2650471 RepID=A0A5K7X885_9BACT|nr:DUF1559 domain-containing protein [Lacipirellula parvula]BBO32082.1 hypothetical protein PLANPX_1694 [Lacipirellula parvula]
MTTIRNKRAFTLVELLVVIAIIGVLVALLLPAVQAAREASRRASCLNNMRQLMLGFQNHASAKGAFPPARINAAGRQHGWFVDLLPYLEQATLANAYDDTKNFYAPENEAAGNTPLPIAICASSPQTPTDRINPLTAAGGMPFNTTGFAADYSVAYLLDAASAVATGVQYGSDDLRPVLYGGPGEDDLPHPMKWVTDGLSYTTLIVEQAGRPDHYLLNAKQSTNSKLQYPTWWMAWASQRIFVFQGYDGSGLTAGAACAVNCSNSQGIYAFHPSGANVSFCDGSARFISQEISVRTMFAYMTRAADDGVYADE